MSIAARIEGRLGAVGVTAFLTRGTSSDAPTLTEPERAAFANDVDADLVISLHTDGHDSPHAQGVATFYYGSGGATSTHSVIGEAFADLVQREIVARTEQYFCPIKHAHKILGTHALYNRFLAYGDADDFETRLEAFRVALGKPA